MYLKLAKKYSLYNKVLYTQCVRAHEHVGVGIGTEISLCKAMLVLSGWFIWLRIESGLNKLKSI